MLRITMIRLKRAWSLALFLRNRGDIRHAGRLQRLPMARAAQKSTYSRKENECQKCKQIIDYLFSPLRTSEEIRRIQSIIIEDIKRLQRSLNDNSVDNRDSNYHVCAKGQQDKAQKIIDAIFGEEKPLTDNIMTTKAVKEKPDSEFAPTAIVFSKKVNQGESDRDMTPNVPVQEAATSLATTKKHLDPLNVGTPVILTPESGTFLTTTTKQLKPAKHVTPVPPIPETGNLLASAAQHLDPVQVASIEIPFPEASALQTDTKKAGGTPGTLLSTTAKQTEEQLVQKVETIEETPLVEAENPKLTGFNTLPRVLGDTEKDLYIAPEIEIDRETVIRDNVRHTFEKIVRRLESTELLAGINPLQYSVVNCVSGGSNPGGSKPPDKSGDSSKNKKQPEQNKYDAIAKQFLGKTPSNQIDARLVKEMKQLGVPASEQKSTIEVLLSKNQNHRKPSEKTVLELEARKIGDALVSKENKSKEKSRIANVQSDSDLKLAQKTDHKNISEDKQIEEKSQVLTFKNIAESKVKHKNKPHSSIEGPAPIMKSDPSSKIDTSLLAQGIRYTEETSSDAQNLRKAHLTFATKESKGKTNQIQADKSSREPVRKSDDNAKIKADQFTPCISKLSYDKYSYKELGNKADHPLAVKTSKPFDRTFEEHIQEKDEAIKHYSYNKLPNKEPVYKVDQTLTYKGENTPDDMSDKHAHTDKSHILVSPTEPYNEDKFLKSAKNNLSPWTTKHPYYQELSKMEPKSANSNETRGQNILHHTSQKPTFLRDTSIRPPYDAHKPLESLDSKHIAAENNALKNYTVLSKKHKNNTKQNNLIKETIIADRPSTMNTPALKHIATDPEGSGYTVDQAVNYIVNNTQKPPVRKSTPGEALQNNQTLREIQKRSAYDAHKPILNIAIKDEPTAIPKATTPSTEQSVYYTVEDKNEPLKERKHDHQKLFKQSQHIRDAQNWSSRQFLNYRKDKLLSNHPVTANSETRHEKHHQRKATMHKTNRKTTKKMPHYYPQVNPQMLFYPNYQEPPFPFPEFSNANQPKEDPFPGQPPNQRNTWPKTFVDRPQQQFIPYVPDPTNPEVFKQHALTALYTEERKPVFDPNKPILNPYEKDYYKKNANEEEELTAAKKQNVIENYSEPAANLTQEPPHYPAATPQMYFYPSAHAPQFNAFAGQWVNRNLWPKTPQSNPAENYDANQQTNQFSSSQQKTLSFYVDENKPENQYTNVKVTETNAECEVNKDSTTKTGSTEHSGFTYHIPNSWLDQYPYYQEQMSYFQQQTPYYQQTHFNAQNQIPQNGQNVDDQESDPQTFPYQNPYYWKRQPYFQGQQQGFNYQRFSHYQEQNRDLTHNNTYQSQNQVEELEEGAPQQYNPYITQYAGPHVNYHSDTNPEEGSELENIDSHGKIQAKPVEQLQGALYTAGNDYSSQVPGPFHFPQQHDQWSGQFPYYQNAPTDQQMRFESSDRSKGLDSYRTLENMERRPPYDPHKPLTNQRGAESNAEAEEGESEEVAGQPWMNQFPGAYPGVTPHGMFYPNAFPDGTQQPDPQHPYFHQNFTPYANAGQLQQNEWIHPFSPEGQMQQYGQYPSNQKQSGEDSNDGGMSPGDKTPIQALQMRPDLNKPKGPKTPPPGPAAAFISLPQVDWNTATRTSSPENQSSALGVPITPLPETVPLDISLPLSEILRRVRKRSRLEYIAKWTQMDVVKGKCGRERPPCPPPQPVCPKPEPTPPPACPPPPPPCPRPCKPKCPPPCIPPTRGCPPSSPTCKFESVSLGDTLYHIFTLFWDFGFARFLHRRSTSDARCVTQAASPTKAIVTDEEIPIKFLRENQFTTYGSNLGSYCWKLETLALARGFEPWVPMPSWPLPVKQEKKKLVCPKEGCKTPPPPRHGTKCERPCYPGNPCTGFPNTYRKS